MTERQGFATGVVLARLTCAPLAHKALDQAVFDAYGWDTLMSDEEMLAALLELNLERPEVDDSGGITQEVDSEPEDEANCDQ